MDGELLGKFVGTSEGAKVIGASEIGAPVIGGMVLITVSTSGDESDSDDTFCPGTYSIVGN